MAWRQNLRLDGGTCRWKSTTATRVCCGTMGRAGRARRTTAAPSCQRSAATCAAGAGSARASTVSKATPTSRAACARRATPFAAGALPGRARRTAARSLTAARCAAATPGSTAPPTTPAKSARLIFIAQTKPGTRARTTARRWNPGSPPWRRVNARPARLQHRAKIAVPCARPTPSRPTLAIPNVSHARATASRPMAAWRATVVRAFNPSLQHRARVRRAPPASTLARWDSPRARVGCVTMSACATPRTTPACASTAGFATPAEHASRVCPACFATTTGHGPAPAA